MKHFGKKCSGWTALGAVAILASAIIGGLAFSALVSLDGEHPVGSPWYVTGILFMPVAFLIQLLLKLIPLKNTKGLSRSERRRLEAIVEAKIRQVWIGIIFCIISTVFSVLVFVSKGQGDFFYIVGMIVIGGFLGITICILVLLINEISKVHRFVETVKERHAYKSVVEKAVKDLEG